ncbi:MAG: hypothetical protein DWQ07_06675 [Chloroflexi bacterium]|nr:MAG: hypothetical protein DWQ07_06675 [Chloroflexota bacterium]MBL1195616.1 hypothetical protein [Chloroflexota bacterium]NOH12904.1 hypothetical protein [Chloroflexota bacterium]
MTKGFALVLIPSSTPAEEIERAVSDLLDPHASYMESFEPYQVPCVNCCVSADIGIREANERVGDFHRLWHIYLSFSDEKRPDWKSYIGDWEKTAIDAARSSPHYKLLAPQCDLCNGTGIGTVTYNVSGINYEGRAMTENTWDYLGPVKELAENSGSYEIVVTPDGQAHDRWSVPRSAKKDEWEARTQEIFRKYEEYIVYKVFINK